MPPNKIIKRSSIKKPIGRSKKLSNIYEEFDDIDDIDSNSTIKIPKTNSMGKTIFISLVMGIFIGGGLGLFYNQSQSVIGGQNIQDIQNKTIQERVSSLIRYSSNTEPLVRKIEDITGVKNYPLYQHSQNGDIVVIYDDITIVYDEVNHKLVSAVPQNMLKELVTTIDTQNNELEEKVDNEITNPLDVEKENKQATTIENTTPNNEVPALENQVSKVDAEGVTPISTTLNPKDVTLEVRNGTNIAGLASRRAKEITTEFGYTVKSANALNKEYKETVLVDLSGAKLSSEIEKIVGKFNIQKIVNELPKGEASTTSKLLIIFAK